MTSPTDTFWPSSTAAEQSLLRARRIAERELGPRDPTTLRILSELARGYGYQDKPEADCTPKPTPPIKPNIPAFEAQ